MRDIYENEKVSRVCPSSSEHVSLSFLHPLISAHNATRNSFYYFFKRLIYFTYMSTL